MLGLKGFPKKKGGAGEGWEGGRVERGGGQAYPKGPNNPRNKNGAVLLFLRRL